MIHTKHVLFVVTSFVLAGLIYGSSSTFDVFVQGKPVVGTHIDCTDADFFSETCCWWEDFGTYIAHVCQTCYADGYGGYEDCDPIEKQRTIKGGDVIPSLEEGILEQPLTTPTTPTPPLFGRNVGNAPLAGGVLQQPTTTPTAPPLFGRNEGAVPQTGGIEQPFTSIPFQQIPQGTVQGQDQPFQGPGILQPLTTLTTPTPTPPPQFGQLTPEGPALAGEDGAIQPMNTTFPTPEPFPPPPTPGFPPPPIATDVSPDLAPEDDQDETDDDDGGNDIVPDTGIAEQPETQGPEGPSNEEQ
jgi:hypothetical protein